MLSCGARLPFEISTIPDHARPVRRCSSRSETALTTEKYRTRFGYLGVPRLSQWWHGSSGKIFTNQRRHSPLCQRR